MGLADFFRKLTGAGTSTASSEHLGDPVEYQGYTIHPAPKAQGGQFLTAGIIAKAFPEGVKEQRFIRADTHASFDDACAHAVSKAQQIIREQGDRLFQQQA